MEEAILSKSKEYIQIMKGKRTKRPRQASPLALTIASTTSSTTAEGSSGGGASEFSGGGLDNPVTTTSPSNSVQFTNNLEEEQDMANCLILLAQGGQNCKPSETSLVVNPTIINKQTRLYIYQCKTCDRCFPSFQALGGHRASHKKAKSAALEKVALVSNQEIENDDQDHHSTTLSLQIQSRSPVFRSNINVKTRVHECSVCGAEFSSGQALGGHMRRHRTVALASTTSTTSTTSHDESSQLDAKKSRNVIALDLNLPAPEDHDDHHHRSESKFGFGPKEQQVIVFSASSLLDCHY